MKQIRTEKNKERENEKAVERKRFSHSVVASWIFGVATFVILVIVLFIRPELTPDQRGILRFVMAICAAFLSFFFLGGIILKGTFKGFTISAVGGFALFFVMMYFINPFPGKTGLKEWKGGIRLGSLLETLNEAYAEGDIQERIQIGTGHEDRVMNFRPNVEEFVGESWVELLKKVCDLHPCLTYKEGPGNVLMLFIKGEVEKHYENGDKFYWYTCK